MRSNDREVARKVAQWLEHAEEDLRLARHALKLKSAVPYRLIAYHSQQCAEKYLKAFLVLKRVDFPYTHRIMILLELCEGKADWLEDLWDVDELTQFAITARYPGVEEKVTRKEALRSIALASKVRKAVRDDLKKRGLISK